MERDRELAVTEFSRDVAVDASAGTGKTATLVARVVNLFLRAPDLGPDEVLLLTFTEKAAGEMKARVVEGWETLLSACRAGGPLEDVRAAARAWNSLVAVPEGPGVSAESVASRVGELVEGIGRLSVTTFHAFCRRILLSFPAEAGVDPRFTVLAEAEAADAWDTGFRSFLRAEFGAGETDPRWDLLLSRGPGPESLFGMIRTLCLSQRDLLLRAELDLGAPSDLLAGLRDDCAPHVAWFREFVGGIRDPEHEMVPELRGALGALEAAWDAVVRGDFDAAAERAPEGARAFGFRADRTRSRKSFPAPPGSTLAATRDALRGMFETLGGAKESDAAARFLVDRARAALSHYLRAKGESLDFMDLLLRANDLLERRPDVAARLSRRFRYIFVDEFQDTDPLQAAMLEALAGRGSPGRLFVVGDPKQSIYGFRRADIQIYSRFRGAMIARGGLPVTLVRNFRSRPDLIGCVNGIFRGLLTGREDFSPAHAPVVPNRTDAAAGAPASWFRLGEDVPEEEFLCRLILGIAGTVRVGGSGGAPERPASLRDIAVLYRADAGGELLASYVEAMVRAGIPHVVPPRRGFFTRQEVQDLRLVLRAADAPADLSARYAALKTIFFGLSDGEILPLCGRGGASPSPRLEDALRILSRLSARRGRDTLPDLLSALFDETGIEYVAARLPEGERIVANLRKAHRMAREFEARGGSLSAFAAELRRWAEEDRGEAEFPSFDEGEDAVRVSSIHAAKGLEFPVVILAGLSRGGRKGVSGLRVDRVRGLSAVVFPGVRSYSAHRRVPRGGASVPFEAWEREKQRAEELRLLYVAATRARDRLYFLEGGRGMGSELLFALREALSASDDAGESSCPVTGLAGRRRIFPPFPTENGIPSEVPEGRGGAGEILLVDVKERLPVGAPRPGVPAAVPPDAPPDAKEPDGGGTPATRVPLREFIEEEAARAFGEKVHKALEAFPPVRAPWPPRAPAPPAAGFSEEEERRFRAIARTIAGCGFFRRLGETELVGTEVPLLSFSGGTSREERADLVVRVRGGERTREHWVVDYKTGRRDPAAEESYRRQVAGYVEALRNAWRVPVRGFLWYVETGETVEIAG